MKHLVLATEKGESGGIAGFQVSSSVAALMAVVSKGQVFSITDIMLAKKAYLLIYNSGREECECRGEITDLATLKYPHIKFSGSHEAFIFSIS